MLYRRGAISHMCYIAGLSYHNFHCYIADNFSNLSKFRISDLSKFRSRTDCRGGITLELGADNRWRHSLLEISLVTSCRQRWKTRFAARNCRGTAFHRNSRPSGDDGRCWRGIAQNQPGASNKSAEAEHSDYVDIPGRAAPVWRNEQRIAA